MTLFECDRLEETPLSCLDSARELRVKSGRRPAAAKTAAAGAPGTK